MATFEAVETHAENCAPAHLPRPGTDTQSGMMLFFHRSIDWQQWHAKLQILLLAPDASAGKGVEALPTPAQFHAWATAGPDIVQLAYGTWFLSPLLQAAELCEQAGQLDKAMAYVTAVLEYSAENQGTEQRPSCQAQAHLVHARLLASQGELSQAEAAFERSLEISQRVGLHLLKAIAIKQMVALVLEPTGRAANVDVQERVQAATNHVHGSTEELHALWAANGVSDAAVAAATSAVRELTLMVHKNDLVPATRKLKARVADLVGLLSLLVATLGLDGPADAYSVSIVPTNGSAEPTPIESLQEFEGSNKAKIQVWPRPPHANDDDDDDDTALAIDGPVLTLSVSSVLFGGAEGEARVCKIAAAAASCIAELVTAVAEQIGLSDDATELVLVIYDEDFEEGGWRETIACFLACECVLKNCSGFIYLCVCVCVCAFRSIAD